jgi:hypothetical protein
MGYSKDQPAGSDADMFVDAYKKDGSKREWRVIFDSGTNESIGGITTDGDYVYVSYAHSDTGGYLHKVVKLDETDGTVSWRKQLSISDTTITPRDLEVGGTDVYALVYLNNTVDNSEDGTAIIKLNSSGVLQWTKRYTVSNGNFTQMEIDSSGNFILAGGSADAAGAGASDLMVAKFNDQGTEQWAKLVGTTGTDSTQNLTVLDNGNYAISEIKMNITTKFDAGVTILSASGSLVDSMYVSSDDDNYWATSFIGSPDGYALTGYSYASSASDADALIVHMNEGLTVSECSLCIDSTPAVASYSTTQYSETLTNADFTGNTTSFTSTTITDDQSAMSVSNACVADLKQLVEKFSVFPSRR